MVEVTNETPRSVQSNDRQVAMLLSTQLLIAAFKNRRQFLAKHTGTCNPRTEATILRHDVRRVGSKKQRHIVLFNFG
jgi:hypothetical protein